MAKKAGARAGLEHNEEDVWGSTKEYTAPFLGIILNPNTNQYEVVHLAADPNTLKTIVVERKVTGRQKAKAVIEFEKMITTVRMFDIREGKVK